MRKGLMFSAILPLIMLCLAGTSYSWQGRMAGMGDPYGLLSDKSDFLIHPAKIAKGEGVKFYGDYRFTYTGVTDWGYDLDRFDTAGTLLFSYYFNTSGQEYAHDTLLGTAFPLGAGRMGLFLTYDGRRGDYNGYIATYGYGEYELMSDLDNFALRLLYGLPVSGFRLGGELQFAYIQEENETWFQRSSFGILNWGTNETENNINPFMFPYDSAYWEALIKGSLAGSIGPTDIDFTMRGGFIFAGDNAWELDQQLPIGNSIFTWDLDGDVQGWRIGGDLWIRYPIDSLTLPFLVRVDYQEKTRTGDGIFLFTPPERGEYEHTNRRLEIEMGGGVATDLAEGTRIAAGIYYGYLQGTDDFGLSSYDLATGAWERSNDFSDYPSHTEHRVRAHLVGEYRVTPVVVLRMGLGFFYGWVKEDFVFTYTTSSPSESTEDISLYGSHWGIGVALGGSVTFQRITLEPFLNAGYQELNLAGDGDRVAGGVITGLYEMDKIRREWFIGGGFSVLFDVP